MKPKETENNNASDISDREIQHMPVSYREAEQLPPLWPGLRQKLESEVEPELASAALPASVYKKRWRWAPLTAALGAALLLLLVLTPFNREADQPVPGDEQVVVHSVKIGSKAAKYYIFQSDNPDRVIVWAQGKTQ